MANNKVLEAVVSIAGQLDPSLQKSLSSATKKFSGMKVGMAAVGTAAVAASAAVVKFGVDAVQSAAAFEKQMANVATLLDGTGEQVSSRISELSDDVLKVSNATGVSTDELSDGLYQIISAVGDSEDAISQMELAAKAARAGGAETTDAINLLTAVTKGYNDTSGEAFQKASDLAFMTVKLGQTSFPELASSMGKVIPLSSALGVKQEELFGSFAALTGVTGSTAEVATQMKAVMSGLMSPTDGMTKALESLGYSNANAALEALGLQGTLDALGGTVGGDTQALAKMFSSVEAQTAILALAGAQSEDFTNKTAAMYEASGATDAAFEKQADTLENMVACIKNLGKNFMTSIGMKILPVVKSVAEKLLPAVQTGLDNLEPVLSAVYSALSPVIEGLGGMMQNILPNFQDGVSGITGIFSTLSPVMQQIADSVMPPLSELFGKLSENFAKIRPVIAEFVANLIPQIGNVLSAITPVIGVVVDALGPVIDMVGNLVSALLPALTNIISLLAPILQTAATVIVSAFSNALDFLMPIIQNLIAAFTGICDFINNVFKCNWSGAWESVKSIFANIWHALEGLAKAPLNAIVSMVNGVISGINSCGFTIPDWVPVVGGKAFQLNIPTIPMFASGGFTNGPSIAGEAGTEAVISFDKAVRDENLSYWAQAGRMLGVDDNALSAFESGSVPYSGGDSISVTFAPQITIQGTGDTKEDILSALRKEEEEFVDMIEEMLSRRGGDKYVYS